MHQAPNQAIVGAENLMLESGSTMEVGDTSLTVKISGKDSKGKNFQEAARLEAFGSFGVLIYTEQSLGLGSVIHVCGGDNKPIASAEVVWIRGGDSPSVEVLLHRSTDLEEVAALNENVTPVVSGATRNLISGIGDKTAPLPSFGSSLSSSKSPEASIKHTPSVSPSTSSNADSEASDSESEIICNSCNKSNPVTSKSCKFCGSYLSRSTSTLRSSTLSKAVQEVKAAHTSSSTSSTTDSGSTKSTNSTNSQSSQKPSSSSTSKGETTQSMDSGLSAPSGAVKRPVRESRSEATARVSAQDRAKAANLVKQRNMSLVALIIFVVVLLGTFVPIGEALSPTPLDVIEQNGCLPVNNVKRQTTDSNRSGELEYWTQDKAKTSVQFVKKQINIGEASKEIDGLAQAGAEIHGYWCPKADSKLNSNITLPTVLSFIWKLKPTGEKAKDVGEISLQLKDRTLVVKEIISGAEIDRTKDIKQATYYVGQQKLSLSLDATGAKVSSPTVKELTFYLPSNQDPVPVAEGVLTNTVRPFYIGEYINPGGSTDIRQLLRYIFGALVVLTLGFLGFNFYQSRS